MKGLEALERIGKQKTKDTSFGVDIKTNCNKDYQIIEKELKEGEENKKMLNVFKNALTIEYHEYPTIEQHNDSEDEMSYLVKELYTIRQSELEQDMRKALREWVLKNAFLKELKALEIIKVLFNGRAKLYERNDGIQQVVDKNGNYRKTNCVVYILDFHVGMVHYEFHLHKEEYDLLKEVLL